MVHIGDEQESRIRRMKGHNRQGGCVGVPPTMAHVAHRLGAGRMGWCADRGEWLSPSAGTCGWIVSWGSAWLTRPAATSMVGLPFD